ncbi:MAG: HAMP domain-containing histidine kinase [Clostridia bacterium]|nr:HAMP domain-containing histidine kinase [Clostridia bacterium]
MKFRMKMTLVMLVVVTFAYSVGCSLVIGKSHADSLEREKNSAVSAYRTAVTAIGLVNGVDVSRSFANISNALNTLAKECEWTCISLEQGGEEIFFRGKRLSVLPDTSKDRYALTTFSFEGRHYIFISGALSANGKGLELTTVTDISRIYSERDELQQACRGVFVLLFIFCGTLAWLLSWWLTRPLTRMSAITKKIAGGDFSARVNVNTKDEVGSLAKDFSYMTEKLEESMNSMKEEMERQERFMGNFAHELKTPMTSVIGYADLIRTQALGEEETMEAANYIFSEGKRLESLSLKLLELLVAKNTKPELVKTDMEQLVVSVVSHLRPIYRENGIILGCKTTAGSWDVDSDLIKSLIVNLADNSRKAMEDGGNVYVVLDWPDGNCRIRVLDNGRGIPEERLSHLTEAFYRVDKSRSRAQGGAGLGLSLCREIVLLHNGSMTFDSRVGNGTCVTVVLKAVKE